MHRSYKSHTQLQMLTNGSQTPNATQKWSKPLLGRIMDHICTNHTIPKHPLWEIPRRVVQKIHPQTIHLTNLQPLHISKH